MRILLAMMLLAGAAFGQAPKAPEQGPPPKNLVKQPDGHVSANGAPANPEKYETHVVQAGETLSQIAESVLKDARLWPQLWEMNEHIVNPHWIYPGDPILIHPITKITDAAPPAAPETPPPPAVQRP
jgi:nucleoid-associated protein YgaU